MPLSNRTQGGRTCSSCLSLLRSAEEGHLPRQRLQNDESCATERRSGEEEVTEVAANLLKFNC